MGQGQFRGIVTIVTFLAIILIVMGFAASSTPTFLATTSPDAPDASGKTNPTNFLSWNETNAFYLNVSQSSLEYEVPDWHWLWTVEEPIDGSMTISVITFDHWWILHINLEPLTWYNETTGTQLSYAWGLTQRIPLSTISAAYDSSYQINYRLTNTRGSLHVYLSWDFASYGNNMTAVYYGNGLFFTLRQDFSDRQTTINLMDILAGLFLGSLFGANILGIDPVISAIITIALDASMAYLVFSIVRSMIPFINGSD